MRKMLPIVGLLAPLWLAGCADDETVVVHPPQESRTVVVPQASEPSTTVVVPDDDVDVKVCPEGSVC